MQKDVEVDDAHEVDVGEHELSNRLGQLQGVALPVQVVVLRAPAVNV